MYFTDQKTQTGKLINLHEPFVNIHEHQNELSL